MRLGTILIYGLLAAMANVVGGLWLTARKQHSPWLLHRLIALGAGFMLAAVFLEMVPESLHIWAGEAQRPMLLFLCGYLLVQFFEHTLAPHFHFGEETHAEEFAHAHRSWSVLLGLIIHTFFDGIAIASAFLVSNWLGWVVFIAVFLHKIPEGSTVSSVMLASGKTKGVAWGASALLGASTLAGVLTMALFRNSVSAGLPLAAGVTIYVAASDLIPEVNKEPGIRMALVVFLGVALLFGLDLLFHSA